MNLQDVQLRNNARKADVLELIEQLNQDIESAQEILESTKNMISSLKTEQSELIEQLIPLKEQITVLKKRHTEEIEDHKQALAMMDTQHKKLIKLIQEAQDEYTLKVQQNNALRDSLEDDKKDLKERELSFNAKIRAFKKEKEEFNFERRKFQAEKGAYSDIID